MSSQPGREDFHFDFLESQRQSRIDWRLAAAVIAGVLLVGIILVMSTNLASWVLPMDEEYLQILVPVAPDGAEPLSLKSLEHQVELKTISVKGFVLNRTNDAITDLLAVVTALDTTGRFGQTLEVPVEPAQIAAQGTASFSVTMTLQEKPDSYSVKFRVKDGPFVPHKDERFAFGVY